MRVMVDVIDGNPEVTVYREAATFDPPNGFECTNSGTEVSFSMLYLNSDFISFFDFRLFAFVLWMVATMMIIVPVKKFLK